MNYSPELDNVLYRQFYNTIDSIRDYAAGNVASLPDLISTRHVNVDDFVDGNAIIDYSINVMYHISTLLAAGAFKYNRNDLSLLAKVIHENADTFCTDFDSSAEIDEKEDDVFHQVIDFIHHGIELQPKCMTLHREVIRKS